MIIPASWRKRAFVIDTRPAAFKMQSNPVVQDNRLASIASLDDFADAAVGTHELSVSFHDVVQFIVKHLLRIAKQRSGIQTTLVCLEYHIITLNTRRRSSSRHNIVVSAPQALRMPVILWRWIRPQQLQFFSGVPSMRENDP